MESNITINIVEPGSTPIEPVVPNTGLFTHGIGGPEATILGITAAVIILAVVLAVLYYRNKKQGKFINLRHKKATTIGLASLAAVVSLGTVAGLLKLGANATDDSLTVTSSSEELTIELADEPVFAVLPVGLTVAEATEAGYTLTAYAEDTNLVSTTDSSNVIPMVTLPEPLEPNEEGVGRGWSPVTKLTDNTYGLALVEPEDKADEVYAPLSTDADNPTFITDKDYLATEAEDITTIYYGFYITPDIPKGTYTSTNINYEAQPNHITNLSFDGNGSDSGVAMEGMIIIAGDTITLPENTFTKEGYTFTEWNTQADGEGKAYADKAEFTASLDKSEDITLYAQWEEDLPIISDLTEMQDFAKLSAEEKASVLASMTPGQQYQLQDNRDQTMYYIAKLADGHVWMTQNLDLDLNNQTELTPENTNIKAKWTPENSTLAVQGTSVPGWQSSTTAPYSADPGDIYYYTSGNNDNDTATDKATCEQAHQDGSCEHYHAGNYYNWSAAVASNDTSEYGDDDQYVNIDTSICPAGWRLPKNANAESYTVGNEQITMITSYDGILGEWQSGPPGGYYSYLDGGFNAIRTAPLWLARSGFVSGGSPGSTGREGCYWSSTVSNSYGAHYLSFSSGAVTPANINARSLGCSVRCVAQ